MRSYTPIDYANAYFHTPILPRTVGQPTFDKLRAFKKALNTNTESVQSDIGGGTFGHLGLVLDDTKYYDLTGHHYIRPLHPEALVVVAGTAHHEAVRLREEHAENI